MYLAVLLFLLRLDHLGGPIVKTDSKGKRSCADKRQISGEVSGRRLKKPAIGIDIIIVSHISPSACSCCSSCAKRRFARCSSVASVARMQIKCQTARAARTNKQRNGVETQATRLGSNWIALCSFCCCSCSSSSSSSDSGVLFLTGLMSLEQQERDSSASRVSLVAPGHPHLS